MVNVGVCLQAAPRLLQDIVLEILNAEPDIKVVTLPADASVLNLAVRWDALDALVVCPAPETDQALALFTSRPGLNIISLSPDGRDASLLRLLPLVTTIDAVSAATLLAALRTPPFSGGVIGGAAPDRQESGAAK